MKHLTMNKKRTIVTIMGVILSTALMVGIGLLFASLRDNNIKTISAHNGSQHVSMDGIEGSKLKILENNVELESALYKKDLGYAKIESTNSYKPYLLISEGSKGLLESLKLTDGRLPENTTEVVISGHLKSNGGLSYKVGDTLETEVGDRQTPPAGEEEDSSYQRAYIEGETLTNTKHKTYKIVGIVERTYLEGYSSPGYMIFSKSEKIENTDIVDAYITYKNTKDIYDKADKLALHLGIPKAEIGKRVHYNDSLLSVYGESRYTNILDSMIGIILIVLALISVGCIVVIYNSFAISVMERKKQFGLFSSIGATRKQIRHTVFFEACAIGIIGIPLGIIGAIVGIGTVLMIINQLLPNVFDFPLVLSIYPVYIIIPVIFMVVVIFLSAFLPAKKASKITPIEAIRQNDDIKIKGKKLRTPKFIKKIFGIEGEIALKNIKRNKKKYRITIISLFMSIVLFVSFSSLMEYGISTSNDMVTNPDYDLMIYIDSKDETEVQKLYNKILQNEETKKAVQIETTHIATDYLEPYWSEETKSANESSGNGSKEDNYSYIQLIKMDEKAYKEALANNHLTYGDTLLLNQTKNIVYKNGTRKVSKFRILSTIPSTLDVYELKEENVVTSETTENKEGETTLSKEKVGTVKNIKEAKKAPFALGNTEYINVQNVIVSNEAYKNITSQLSDENASSYTIFIKAPEFKNLDKTLKELEKSNTFENFSYLNVVEALQLQKNLLFVMKLLLYGFITLVTLIGVTSVFNTINTSIALRRKEFAMLRSMGLTPRGFNKILYFESIFFGLKSLLYGIPVSLLITYLFGTQFGNIVTSNSFLFPLRSILIATAGVFVIVFMTMMYASSRIKKENILEAIREENI